MNYEEAYNQLIERICCEGKGGKVYHFCDDSCMYNYEDCPVAVAKKALKRHFEEYKPLTIPENKDKLYCSNCGRYICRNIPSRQHYIRYCKWCGKEIDWSKVT